jgi:hypothetical protein
MKQLDQIVNKDPLKLKKYDTGEGGNQFKMIYIFLLLVPVLLIFSVLFWVFGAMTSTGNEVVTFNGNNPNDSSDND